MDKNVSGFVKHFLRETHNMSVITEALERDPGMGRDNYPNSSVPSCSFPYDSVFFELFKRLIQ